jgi:hypothetical protein
MLRFVWFYRDAVYLWKHDKRNMAAFILGRALHLVEDMAQPQHAMNEAHMSQHKWYAQVGGTYKQYNPSYVEYFVEAHIHNKSGALTTPTQDLCEYNVLQNNYVDYDALIRNLNDMACPSCSSYRSYFHDAVLWSQRAADGPIGENQGLLGRSFSAAQLEGWFNVTPDHPKFTPLQSAFEVPFQYVRLVCGTKEYRETSLAVPLWHKSDYIRSGSLGANTTSLDLGFRLREAELGALGFAEWHMSALLRPAVADAAGVLIAFWDEVKNDTPGLPKLCEKPAPSGESPDDSMQVKSTPREQSEKPSSSSSWQNECRVGIGKGLPTMADYGVSSSLFERLTYLPEGTDPAIAEALYARFESLEQRYSGPQNMMPDEVERAPAVAVWEKGFGDSAVSLIESLQEPVKILEEPREPVFTDEESLAALPPTRGLLDADASKQRILVLPTGSLYGLRRYSVEHSALQSFVEQGGVVVAFTEPFGEDFSALPVPSGEKLTAAGFKQDLSCFAGSAFPTMEHPILSGVKGAVVTAGFDGFFRKVPSNSTVLMRRTVSGEPCMIVYPVGQGYVVASTMYEDWAFANGQSSFDGRTLVANIISWAKNPGATIPVERIPAGGSVSGRPLTLHVRNLSDTPADQVNILVMTPDRQDPIAQFTQAVSLPGHSEADVSVSVSLPALSLCGIYHVDYRLLAADPTSGQEEEIQPQGESDSGRLAIEFTGDVRQAMCQTIFSVWTDNDIAGDSAAVVHMHFEDHTGAPRTMHLWTCYEHEYGILLDTVTLAPNGVLDRDYIQNLTLPGPYHFYLTDPVYGLDPYAAHWLTHMFGNDPWKMAAQAYAFMFSGTSAASLSSFNGLAASYEPEDTVAGGIALANLGQVPADFTVAFTLTAAGLQEKQSQSVHLEAGTSQDLHFALPLPGPIAYYASAQLSVAVSNAAAMLLTRNTCQVAVNPWTADLSMASQWPTPSASATEFPGFAVHLENIPGPRTIASSGASLKVSVRQTWPDYAIVHEQTMSVPDLQPGQGDDIEVTLPGWTPLLQHNYVVTLSLRWGGGAREASKEYAFLTPSIQLDYAQYPSGSMSLALEGLIHNSGDFAWPLTLQWELPAAGQSTTQTLLVAPRGSAPIQWSVPGPPVLPAGPSTFSVSLAGSPLTSPILEESLIVVPPPQVSLLWPVTPPIFRHDQNGILPITLTCSGLAGTLEATLDASLVWEGGSATAVSSQPVVLNPVGATVVDLSLPLPAMPAPGPFTVVVAIHAAQGSIAQSWTAGYKLGGPVYSGGFATTVAPPGGTLAGQVQNDGKFEGHPTVHWSLWDRKGMGVATGAWSVPTLPIGGALELSGPIPRTALPGTYTSWLEVDDPALTQPALMGQEVTVTGTLPSVTLATDRDLYGTADPVGLSLHIEDPGHHLEAASAHLEIQRYLGPIGGGTSGTPSASWGTPCTDGSGSFVVSPSAWFVDPSGIETVTPLNVRNEVPVSALPPVSNDIDGDGKADFIVLKGTDLIIASEGDSGANLPKRHSNRSLRERLRAGGAGNGPRHTLRSGVGRSACRVNPQDVFSPSWLTLPVKTTWGQPTDTWTRPFLLGVRDDDSGPDNPLVLGLHDPASATGTVLLVRVDGTVVWRHEFATPFTPSLGGYSNTRSAVGPLFVDLNGDGVKDVLFSSADALLSLDGGNGEVLWSYPLTGNGQHLIRIGRGTTGPSVWIGTQTEQGPVIILLDGGGHDIYRANLQSGDPPTMLVTGDIDGDGNDEAAAWGWGWPSVQTFGTSSSTPTGTAVPPIYSELTLADIDGDSRADAIFAIQGPVTDGIYPLSVQVMDLLTGQVKWVSPMPATTSGYPVNFGAFFVYVDTYGTKELLFEVPSAEGDPYRWFFIDAAEGHVERAIEHGSLGEPYGSILAGDFDGDGLSEFYEDGFLLNSACHDTDGAPIPCEGWQTVWQADTTLSENGAATLDLSYTPGLMPAAGAYRAVCMIATPTNQTIAASPYGFTVSQTNLGLTLSPPAGFTIRSDEPLTGSARLTNRGAATEIGVTLRLLADDQIASTWTLPSLEAGAHMDFPFTLPPSASGGHVLRLEAAENGSTVAALRSGYDSAAPQVVVEIDAPMSHTDAPFTLDVYSYNDGAVPAHLSMALSDDPSGLTTLDLEPEESALTTYTRQTSGAYSSLLTVSGDAEQSIPVSVPEGYQISLTSSDTGPQPTGTVLVPIHIVQTGSLPYDGSLTVRVTPALGAAFVTSWPVHVGPTASVDLNLALPIAAPGSTHLNIQADRTTAVLDKDLLIYQGGMGTLAVQLPQTLGEGMAEIPFTVQNEMPVLGKFDVQLTWNPGGAPQAMAAASLPVAGSGSATGILAPTFSRGTGTLQALLNGVSVASQVLTVLPLVQADLTLTAERPPDEAPSVDALVSNTGFGPWDGILEVRTDGVSTTPMHVEAGGQLHQSIPINPDGFGGEEAPITVFMHLPDGTSVEKSLTLALTAPQLSMVAPPSPVILTPGQPSMIGFALTNAGDIKAPVRLTLDLEDGESGHFEQLVEVPGHDATPVSVAVDLLPDIPNGTANIHYLARRTDGTAELVAEGELPVTIFGPTVSVTASLDGVAYAVGSSATLHVDLSLTPSDAEPRTVTARVIGGSYESERTISVSAPREETFAIPVTPTLDGVSVEVIQPGGRSLYINRFRVYPLSDGFSIHPNKSVYEAGETVLVSANLPTAGSLHLSFMSQEATLEGSGTLNHSFVIPGDAAEDSYTLSYDFTPTDSVVSPASGGISVDVHGILVTGGESHLDKGRYASGESLAGQIVLYSNRTLNGTLKFWIVQPDGSYAYAGDQVVAVTAGSTPGRFPFALPFTSNQAGTHRLTFALVGSTGTSYVGGSLPFSAGTGVILSVTPSQGDYPQASEPVSLIARAAGTGTGSLTLEVDGSLVGQVSFSLNGLASQTVPIPQPLPGKHAVKATLLDSTGLPTVSRCQFTYGSRLPDLTGSCFAGARVGNTLSLGLMVKNNGASVSSACRAVLYDGDPQAGGTVIATDLVPQLQPAGTFSDSGSWDVTGLLGSHEVYLVIDPLNQVREWDKSNNSSHTAVALFPVPGAPGLSSPADGSTVSEARPTLVVSNAQGTVFPPLTYRFEVYSNQELTALVSQVASMAEGSGTTSWAVDQDLLDNHQYWWRCRATDAGYNSGPWMATATFYVQANNQPPTVPSFVSPSNGATLWGPDEPLTWYRSSDPDVGDTISYDLQVDNDPSFGSPEISQTGIPTPAGLGPISTITVTLGSLTGYANLLANTSYHWRLRAVDSRSLSSGWTVEPRSFYFSVDTQVPSVAWGSPEEGATVTSPNLVLAGTASDDISGVDYVEVSADGGITWTLATGGDSWALSFTPTQSGPLTLLARARDRAGHFSPIAERHVTVDVPSAPLCLMAFPDNSDVFLCWSAPLMQGAVGYNVYRSATSGGPYTRMNLAPLERTDFPDTGLTNDVARYYRVRALFGRAEGDPSVEAFARPFQAGLPPSVLDLVITRAGDDLRLSWSPLTTDAGSGPAFCTGYDIYSGTTPDFVPDLAGGTNRIAAGALPPQTLSGAAVDGQPHYFTLVALDGGVSGPWTEWYEEEDSPDVSASLDWSRLEHASSSGGYYLASSTPEGSLFVSFSGTGISVGGLKGPGEGIASFLLDGIPLSTVDLYAPSALWKSWIRHFRGLSDGAHVLQMTVTGDKNAYSSGTEVTLDQILVVR